MGCLRLDILDEQYYRTEFWNSRIGKESTSISLPSEVSKKHEEQRDEYFICKS